MDRIKLRQKPHAFDAQAIERFGRLMRENITSGPIPFRKAYIKSVVDRVEVDDHAIRIVGDEATLEQVVARDQNATPTFAVLYANGAPLHAGPRALTDRVRRCAKAFRRMLGRLLRPCGGHLWASRPKGGSRGRHEGTEAGQHRFIAAFA